MEQEQKERLDKACEGLTIKAVFVPVSMSRNKETATKQPTLNYSVALYNKGKHVLTTDYSMGMAHCRTFKHLAKQSRPFMRPTVANMNEIREECETGRTRYGAATVPALFDIVYSLTMDSDVLESRGFNDWADNMGYDADSIKARKVFDTCLELALQLRNGIGQTKLDELREAFQDY